MPFLKIIHGDVLQALKTLPSQSINCIITSPPYWGLRDYGVDGQIGLENTLEEYIAKMLLVTKELYRVLKNDGVMFWVHGDCYGCNRERAGKSKTARVGNNIKDITAKFNRKGIPQKCMALQNYRLALYMVSKTLKCDCCGNTANEMDWGKRKDSTGIRTIAVCPNCGKSKYKIIDNGWILRNIIIWHKPNHMPSSVRDRFTNAYEPVFMFTKNKRYWFDLDAVRVPSKTGNGAYQGLRNKNRFGYTSHPHGIPSTYGKELYNHPLGKNPADVWQIPTQPFKEAHFATFPTKLVARMLMAACPKQVCKKCGTARQRITWHYSIPTRKGENTKYNERSETLKKRTIGVNYTVGWTDCGCNMGYDAGVVLDPFMGSGTTLKVAKELWLNAIGIELNEDYIKIAKKRIGWEQSLYYEFYEEKA